MNNGEPLLVSVRRAAELLSLSPRSVQMYIASGALVSRKVGKRRLIPFVALERFARADHQVPTHAAHAKQPACEFVEG